MPEHAVHMHMHSAQKYGASEGTWEKTILQTYTELSREIFLHVSCDKFQGIYHMIYVDMFHVINKTRNRWHQIPCGMGGHLIILWSFAKSNVFKTMKTIVNYGMKFQ